VGTVASQAISRFPIRPRADRRRGRLECRWRSSRYAWAAADVPARTVSLNPVLPKGLHRIEAHGVPFPSGELSVTYDGDATLVIETPHGLRVDVTDRKHVERPDQLPN